MFTLDTGEGKWNPLSNTDETGPLSMTYWRLRFNSLWCVKGRPGEPGGWEPWVGGTIFLQVWSGVPFLGTSRDSETSFFVLTNRSGLTRSGLISSRSMVHRRWVQVSTGRFEDDLRTGTLVFSFKFLLITNKFDPPKLHQCTLFYWSCWSFISIYNFYFSTYNFSIIIICRYVIQFKKSFVNSV